MELQDSSPGRAAARATRLQRLSGWRRIVFPLGAVLLGLAPLAVLEGVLTVLRVEGQDRQYDPFVGFSRTQPLFELDEKEGVYRTALSRQLHFAAQQFAARKTPGTFRVFALGGSTLRGHPYDTETSFLKWLELELNGRNPSRHFETINCGGVSYASYRLARILDEVLQYQPDLIILAAGHNEFLEDRTYGAIKGRSRLAAWTLERLYALRMVRLASRRRAPRGAGADEGLGRLDPEVNPRLDSASGFASYRRDDAWRQCVVEQYDRSVRDMVRTCRAAHVPLVLVNLGENLRDCPPFKSQHPPGVAVPLLQQWQGWFERGTEREEVDPPAALEAYKKAQSIDGEYALLAYRMARCWDRLGETARARRYYTWAKELDVCPLRMLDEMHERLKRIAAETDTPLADAQELLLQQSPGGIPGDNCYLDHVHPTIGAHQQIAQLLLRTLEERSLIPASRPWGEAQRRRAYRQHFQQLGPAYLANGRRRVEWLEDWARRRRGGGGLLPRDARACLDRGAQLLDYGQYAPAWEEYQRALQQDPRLAGKILDHARALLEQGRDNAAEEILLRLHYEPASAALRPRIELAYGVLLLDAGRVSEAVAVYRRYQGAIESAAERSRDWLALVPDALEPLKAAAQRQAAVAGPDFEAGRDGLARLQLAPNPREASGAAGGRHGNGNAATAETDRAIRLLGEAIRRDPRDCQLYLRRARLFLAQGDLGAALEDSGKAIDAAPGNPQGYKLRAVIHMMQGRVPQAVADLSQALELDPRDTETLKARGAAYRRLGEDTKAKADFSAAEELQGRKSER